MRSDGPTLTVVGGPNGSGKTTLSAYLIAKGRVTSDIINPDMIASVELGSYDHQFKAARIALARRNEALTSKNSFSFETTFSGNSEIHDIKRAKALGYQITLYYVALRSVLDNVLRVKERQVKLGHNVDNEDIIRRYGKSRINLLDNIALFDTVHLFDNSSEERSRVAIFTEGELSWLNRKHEDHPFYKEVLNK